MPQRRKVGAPSQVDSENLSDKDQEIVDFAFSQIAGSTVVGKYDCELNQVRTENFTKQIVSGTLYKFDIVLKPECGGEERTCNIVVFDQPWTKTREVRWEDVKCEQPEEQEEQAEVEDEQQFSKFSGQNEDFEEDSLPVAGAPSKVDELSEEEQEIVDFAFSQVAGSTVAASYECELEQVRAVNFTRQVVSGTLFKFALVLRPKCGGGEKTCNMVVFDQPWTGTREVQWDNVICDEPESKVPLPGGLFKIDDLTEEDQEIIDFAFSQVAVSNVAGEYDCNLNQIRTENFSKQTVAGTLFRFDLVLRPECGGDEKICSVVVFDQPWTNTREVRWEDVKCRTQQQENDYEEPEQFNNFGQKNANDFIQIPEDIDQDEQEHNQFNQQVHQSDDQEHNQFNQQKHQFIDEDEQNEKEHEQESNEHQEDEEPQRDFDALGAPSQVDNLSEDDEEIVNFAFGQISGSTLVESFDCDLRKVRTENFTKQIVSGTLYKFDLVLRSECGGDEKVCNLVVFDQPWTETREVRWDDVKCDN